jgi:transglutaminase-like putative cysteine protease
MNDIDRSVEPMDFAVRRRFVWIDIKPEDRMSMWGGVDWFEYAKEIMNNLNAVIRIEDTLGESYCIGPAYFNDPPLDKNNGIDKDDLWSLRLEPIIREYLRPLPKPDANEKLEVMKKVFFINDKDITKIKTLEEVKKHINRNQ